MLAFSACTDAPESPFNPNNGGNGNGKVTDKRTNHLHNTGQRGNKEGSPRLYARRKHRTDNYHTFRDVLKCDTDCHRKRK